MGFNGFMVYQITINSGNARLSQLGIYVRTLDRKKHADCYKIKQNQKKKKIVLRVAIFYSIGQGI